MQNILFHDIDGCLNTIDGIALPFAPELYLQSQKSVLHQLGEALDNSLVDMMVLNTGRSLEAALGIASAINSRKLKYVIAEHGAIGYSLPTSSRLDLAEHARSLPHLGDVYTTVSKIPVLMNWYQNEGAGLLAREIDHLVDISPKLANLTLKIPPGINGDKMLRVIRQLIEIHSPLADEMLVYHHSKSDGYVDVMAEVNKGSGVEIICHLESHQPMRTYAIGNGLNDLPMFECVDLCICPANADKILIEFCNKNKGYVSGHDYIEATLNMLGNMDSFVARTSRRKLLWR